MTDTPAMTERERYIIAQALYESHFALTIEAG